MRIADDGEIQFRGPTLFQGYWNNPDATAAAFTDDGWYMSGDLGQLDEKGRLHLHGRKKDIIVLPNGFNVYPEDIENALRVAGIRDSVAVETRPGRIEVVVLAPGTHAAPGGPAGRLGDREGDAGRPPAPDRGRGEGGQREPGAQPAHRGLAAVAGGGLPADPHVQGEARPGAHVGGGRHAAAGGRGRRRCGQPGLSLADAALAHEGDRLLDPAGPGLGVVRPLHAEREDAPVAVGEAVEEGPGPGVGVQGGRELRREPPARGVPCPAPG